MARCFICQFARFSRRQGVVLALLLSMAGAGLSACVPNRAQKDALHREVIEAALRQNALTALSFARSAQDALTTNPEWKSEALASGDFDTLGIALPESGTISGFKAGYCRDLPDAEGDFREVLTVWPESIDALNFTLKGVGVNSGVLLSQEIANMAGNASVGLMRGGTLVAAGWNEEIHTSLLPAACNAMALPEGTPVLVMEITRDDPGTQAAAKLDYSFDPCTVSGENGAVINSHFTSVAEDGTVTVDPAEVYKNKCY